MKKEKIDNIAWQSNAEKWWYNFWSKCQEPWRPSKKEIIFWDKTIQQILKKKGSIQVLILGATPEFRDLLAKYKNIKVTLLDINPPVKRAMDRLCKKKNENEKLVLGNWLDVAKIFPPRSFDVVMNDEGFENVYFTKHNLLLKNIAKVLKKDGYFLMGRLCMKDAFKHPLNFTTLFKKYQKNPEFFHNFHNRVNYLYRLACSSQSRAYDHKKQGVKVGILADEIIEKNKKLYNTKYLMWTPEVDWQGPALHSYIEVDLESLTKMKSMIEKYFKIEKKYQDLFHPLMKLKYDFVLKIK